VHIVHWAGEHGDDDRLPPERRGVSPGQRRDEPGEAMLGAPGSGRSSRAPLGSPAQIGVLEEEGVTERCREKQRGPGLPREPRSPGLQRRPAGAEAQGGTVVCVHRERAFFPVSVAGWLRGDMDGVDGAGTSWKLPWRLRGLTVMVSVYTVHNGYTNVFRDPFS